MPSSFIRIIVTSLALSAFGVIGCACHAPPSTTVHARSGPSDHARSAYRLDFVLTAERDGAPIPTSFTLNLMEGEKGEVNVGKNVPLTVATSPSGPVVSPRTDVGLKVTAQLWTAGDDVIVDVMTEKSSFEPPSTVHKARAKSEALVVPSKPALVTMIEEGDTRYRLTVTPTKLR